MTLAENHQICTRPFEWCEIHPDGSMFLCCPAWLTRPVGNVLTRSIEQNWNSPIAQEIRKSILNHSFHNCKRHRCPFLASASGPIKSVDTVADPDVRKALQKQDVILRYLPKKLNLCYDDSCNLACPSCRKHIQQAKGQTLEQVRRINQLVMEQFIPQAGEITLSGFGDPFGSPTYLGLLRHLNQESGDLPLIRLHSNGQLWTRELWEEFPNLHEKVIEAEISIDAGSAETYAINRPGGSFQRLLDNLEYLASQPFQLTLSMVVQHNNYREMSALVALADGFGARTYLSKLVNWGTFSRTEYHQRAVHLHEHPEYRQFETLLLEFSGHENVDTGNLTQLLTNSY